MTAEQVLTSLVAYVWVLAFAVWIPIYMLPGIIASLRESESRVALVWLNLFLGWTAIAWVAFFLWAMLDRRAAIAVAPMRIATAGDRPGSKG